MHMCPDCRGRGRPQGSTAVVSMYCLTCGGSGAVNPEECKACAEKDKRIAELDSALREVATLLYDDGYRPVAHGLISERKHAAGVKRLIDECRNLRERVEKVEAELRDA